MLAAPASPAELTLTFQTSQRSAPTTKQPTRLPTHEETISGIVFFRAGQTTHDLSLNVKPGGQATIELPAGQWQFEAAIPGFWARPTTVDLRQAAAISVTLHPTGRVRGKLVVPKASKHPTVLDLEPWVRFEVPPTTGIPGSGSPDALRGRVRCPATENLELQCEVPAAVLDLQVELSGYSSAYRWDVRVRPSAETHLGTLELGPASGIVGWVLAEGVQSPIRGVEIEVRPRRTKAARQTLDKLRAEIPTQRTTTDRRGFFRLHDLAPGAYVLVARQEGFATVRTSVRVTASQLSRVADPPLILHIAEELDLYIDPPIPPSTTAAQWQASLSLVDRGQSILNTFDPFECSAAGVCHIADLARGLYTLTIRDAAGKRWASRELDFSSGVTPTFVNIPIIDLRGTVTFGDEPLADASVFFGGSSGIEMVSNTEGRFSGFLPRSGAWSVEVQASEPPIRRNFKRVEVAARPTKSYAEIELEMPDTRLSGTVVDAFGREVENAIVSATGYDATFDSFAQDHSDEDGEFDFSGLPPGRFILRAVVVRNGKRLQSPKQEMDLRSKVEHEPVRLVVEETLEISGRIVSRGRGVPGALVKMHAVQAMEIAVASETTDFDGRFEASFPPGTLEVLSGVGAPGFGYKISRLRVNRRQELVIEVTQDAGTLVLENLDPEQRRILPILHQRGLEAAHYLKQAWARTNGVTQTDPTRFLIPQLAAGDYTACWAEDPLALNRMAVTGQPLAEGCVSGTLSAGGELVLRMP